MSDDGNDVDRILPGTVARYTAFATGQTESIHVAGRAAGAADQLTDELTDELATERLSTRRPVAAKGRIRVDGFRQTDAFRRWLDLHDV